MTYALFLCLVACQAAAEQKEPDVLCIGDSITHGWAKHTTWACPRDNCRSTRYGLIHLSDWTRGRRYGAIVFNFGIWDVKTPGTPIDLYKRNLNLIIDQLKADKLFFCTTTPGRANEAEGVTPEVVERYNRAALEVMRERGVKVVDLHALCLTHREWWNPQNVHYTDQGYKQMAEYIKQAVP
jgi:hypothetical protein